ncbi:GerAB/ArcD/ProY family transporter [Clostridium sp. YIM B02505]|uniref:GerAB/ArcD/ProY family transporter n=1 Tax=Clostridium yunnanense TaxID=2800325 RepID=A0ABS1EP75_9CLOT|nr:GerAB/ArcD/ProY family transporter [Clostridium yunnanense]MBK1811253.1 GerAB/ArcD/ProY family transporter [Clostridium yunnanense]
MIKEGKFGTREAVTLTTVVLTSKVFYTSISVLFKATSTAAWYATLISCLISMMLFSIVCLLMNRYPNKNLVQIFDIVTGKFIGKILSLIFCAYFIFYSGATIREFVEMVISYVLPSTQPSIIITVLLLIVVSYAYVGIEGIARMAYVGFFCISIGLVTILILPYRFYDINNLIPIGGYGVKSIFSTGFWRASAYSEVIFLAFLSNCLHENKNLKKVGLVSLALSGIIISMGTVCALMAFEYSQGGENLSSLFQLSRIIYINRFLQRIESVFIFIWVIASIINVSVAFYVAISIFCKAFNVSNHRPCLLPFVYFTFMVTLLPKNISEATEVYIKSIRQYSLLITYFIPILVLLISIFRGNKGGMLTNEET